MSIQVKVTGSSSSLSSEIRELIEAEAEDELKVVLKGVAQALVDNSPLGINHPNPEYATGAYISSHSVKFNSSRGKGKSSRGKTKGQLSGSSSDMKREIDNATYEQLSNVTFRNDSPHAQVVEHGGPNWSIKGYKVYEKAAGKI